MKKDLVILKSFDDSFLDWDYGKTSPMYHKDDVLAAMFTNAINIANFVTATGWIKKPTDGLWYNHNEIEDCDGLTDEDLYNKYNNSL